MKKDLLIQLKAMLPVRLKHTIKVLLGFATKPCFLSNAHKKRIEKELLKGLGSCVNNHLRQDTVIISLTSFPERINTLHYTLYSLFKQSMKPDSIVLYLAESQFPNKEKSLPTTITDFLAWGLTIRWCKDVKSYKKLIYAREDYPNAFIMTADDDLYYAVDSLNLLFSAYKQMPDYIHTLRGHRITFDEKSQLNPYKQWLFSVQNVKPSFNNFQTGCGGVWVSATMFL